MVDIALESPEEPLKNGNHLSDSLNELLNDFNHFRLLSNTKILCFQDLIWKQIDLTEYMKAHILCCDVCSRVSW